MTALRQTETTFQDAVIDLAKLYGWKLAHFRPGRTNKGWRTPMQGDTGFPDLVLARDSELVFAELKSDTGKLSPEQGAWRVALQSAGAEHRVWRPKDWDAVVGRLKR